MSDDLWKSLMDEYTTYNQYVDIVSCWESSLKNIFKKERRFKFYRFPPMHHTINSGKYKPDFSVKINKDYGILFEIKVFPHDKYLKEIKKSDAVLLCMDKPIPLFPDNLQGECSDCGCDIYYRPYNQDAPTKLCINCAQKRFKL